MAHKVESGFSPRSVRNHLAVLRAVLKTAVAFGLVDTNVAMKVTAPRHFRKEQRFLTPSEMKAVLDACPRAWSLLSGAADVCSRSQGRVSRTSVVVGLDRTPADRLRPLHAWRTSSTP